MAPPPFCPIEITNPAQLNSAEDDDAFLIAASWEERCLALPRIMHGYRCKHVMVTVYDGESSRRAKHLKELRGRLASFGRYTELPALHHDPLQNVRATIGELRRSGATRVRLAMDVSAYTRRHLLQLLQGLEVADLLRDTRFFYSEQNDYHTPDNEPTAKGIAAIETIRTFGGSNRPSKDSLLILFLGFEGTRAQAIWERLEPNVAVAVLGEATKPGWQGRAEAQNRYILSSLPSENVFYCSLMDPSETVALLQRLLAQPRFSPEKCDYVIAPVGSKPQVLGVYRFWRERPFEASVFYAAPVRYREEQEDFGPGRSWVIDKSSSWPALKEKGGLS